MRLSVDFEEPRRLPNWKWFIPAFIAILLLISGIFYFVWADELMASWYSEQALKDEGTWKLTKGVMANGKKFDEEAFTCATRLFPLGTTLKITDTTTGRKVIVKVTDRIGKRFAKTRIDLSKRAFITLVGSEQGLDKGLLPIKVEVVNE
jgi:rare lipoprotein A